MVPTGILTLSLAVVLMAATASTASAKAILVGEYGPAGEPGPIRASFDFGDRQLGTTSPALHFDLRVGCEVLRGCNTTFNPTISVSGDYAQINNCPPTLHSDKQVDNSGVRCEIEVTFKPTSTGPRQGILSAGPKGPRVALTGNGVTTPMPPSLPPRLDLFARVWQWCGWNCNPGDHFTWLVRLGNRPLVLEKTLRFEAATNYESTLVASGGVERTTEQLAGYGSPTRVTAELKHPKRLNESPTRGTPKNCRPVRRGCTTIKLKVAVTDEFGQTANEEVEVTLYRNPTLPGRRKGAR